MEPIRVVIAGIQGKMGRETVRATMSAPDIIVVGGIDRKRKDTSIQDAEFPFPIYTEPNLCFLETRPDVYVDFTDALGAQINASAAIETGVRPIIGSTGLSSDFLQSLDQELRSAQSGGLFAPNFAIGALLMMKMANLIAPYLSDIEIIEYHHAEKKDAPSGTAKKTAEGIRKSLLEKSNVVKEIPIHSVRLPGYVAHQEILFGGDGEHVTIRHDSMSRTSFMPGVLLGIRKVIHVVGLTEGLEHYLF